MNLDDVAAIARIDVHGAREALAGFPAQCRTAAELRPHGAVAGKRPALVVVAGMGGSAAGGDLLAACAADHLDVPIVVHRGYGLPPLAGEHTLLVASSYSGETAEVISAVEVAIAREIRVLVVTSGGRLGELAREHELARVELPVGLMPRMALGYLFFPVVTALRTVELVVAEDADIVETLAVIDELAAELAVAQPSARNEAKRLALAIGRRLPAVYGGPDTGVVAYRWKTDLEENAKIFALAGVLPEMNHNEIEAWRSPSAANLHLMLLRDHHEPAEIARRFAVLRDMLTPAAGGISEAWTRGRSRLARLLSLTYLGQWTSYYQAILHGADPWSVPLLDELKRRMQA
jgi:glucose/mannose-6-phosphate isomerase